MPRKRFRKTILHFSIKSIIILDFIVLLFSRIMDTFLFRRSFNLFIIAFLSVQISLKLLNLCPICASEIIQTSQQIIFHSSQNKFECSWWTSHSECFEIYQMRSFFTAKILLIDLRLLIEVKLYSLFSVCACKISARKSVWSISTFILLPLFNSLKAPNSFSIRTGPLVNSSVSSDVSHDVEV